MLNLRQFIKRYALPLWPWYIAGSLALALTSIVTLKVPELAKEIVNELAAERAGPDLEEVALTIIALGLTLIFTRALSRILIFWPGRKLEANLKMDLFSRTLALPMQFFERHGMGDLISRLANDVGHLRVFFAFGLLQILNMFFLLSFTIYQMMSVHQGLTVAALSPLIIMVVITRLTMPLMHKYSRANQEATGSLTNRVTEAFINVHVIKANAAERAFGERTQNDIEAVFDSNIRLVTVRTLLFPLMTCLAGLSTLTVLFYGGHEVIAGRLSVGDILAFNVYIALLTFPLTAIGIIMAIYQRMRTALTRIEEIDTAPPELVRPQSSTPDPDAPLLEVRNLSFSFPKGTREQSGFTLDNLSFSLQPGKRIGLFGAIGSGKSTLMNVITRLYDPPEHTVFVRGRDVLEMAPGELRQEVGYALQTVHLFSDSVINNLKFGAEVEQERVVEAAANAQVLQEIEHFDQGWQTEIGEKGVRLSGGQKQRLALARIFVREPPVMLLDDVLSAVDHRTEKALIQAIDTMGSAMLIASHRASALKSCHEILVLEEGRIVDRGVYADLVKRHPGMKA